MELLPENDEDIRLVYIGSAHRAIGYAAEQLPEPPPRPDQILAVTEPRDLAGVQLPPWCHIATELHTTKDRGTFAALEGHEIVFDVARRCRRQIPKAGV